MGMEKIFKEYEEEINKLNLLEDQREKVLEANSRSDLEKELGFIYLGRAKDKVVCALLAGTGGSGATCLLYSLSNKPECEGDPMCSTVYKIGTALTALASLSGTTALFVSSINDIHKAIKHYHNFRQTKQKMSFLQS